MLSGGDEGSLTTRRPLFPGLARSPAHPRSGCGSSRAFARSPALLHGQAAPSTPAPSLCRRFQGSALPVAGCSRNRDKESTKTWSTGEKLNTKAKQLNIANVFIITEGNAAADRLPRGAAPGPLSGGRGQGRGRSPCLPDVPLLVSDNVASEFPNYRTCYRRGRVSESGNNFMDHFCSMSQLRGCALLWVGDSPTGRGGMGADPVSLL